MKLSYKRTFLIGAAFLSITAFWQLYDSIVPLILKDTFGIKETARGLIMALDNLLALFLLPLFGSLSDRTSTRIGKRMPYILAGTFLSSILMILLPVFDSTENKRMFILSLGAVLVSMGIYRTPAVALMPDVTPKPLRSRANAIINLMGSLGGVFTLIMIKLFSSFEGYFQVFSLVAILIIVSVTVLFVTINENRESELARAYDGEDDDEDEREAIYGGERKGIRLSMIFLLFAVSFWFMAYNAVTTAFSSYAQVVWGLSAGGFADCLMVGTVAAIISYLPVGVISTRIGRRRIILLGVLTMAISFTIGAFITTYSAWMLLIFAAVGIGWAMINVNSYPMVVEMALGGDTGKYTGLYYSFSMAAQILTPILSGYLLEHISYGILFPYAAVFMCGAFILMLFVRHGDSRSAE